MAPDESLSNFKRDDFESSYHNHDTETQNGEISTVNHSRYRRLRIINPETNPELKIELFGIRNSMVWSMLIDRYEKAIGIHQFLNSDDDDYPLIGNETACREVA